MQMKGLRVGALFLSVMLLFTTFGSGGCRQSEESGRESPGLSGSITVSGSGTTIPILKALGQDFAAAHPGIEFIFLPSAHTAGGVEGTLNGVLDLGALSRDLEDSEKHAELESLFFCRDALVFATHREVKVRDLSVEQLLDIYAGRIQDWKDVGGDPGTMVIINRPDHSSPKVVLDDKLFGPDFPFADRLVIIERAAGANTAIVETENSLGFTSLGMIIREKSPVNILTVDGQTPDEPGVQSGRYPFFRPLGIVYRSDAPEEIKAFVEYLRGEEAGRIMRDNGYLPG
ncbi:unnamed protein product, partial [marine sediment metagenome]